MVKKQTVANPEVAEFVKGFFEKFGKGEKDSRHGDVFSIEDAAKERSQAVELEYIKVVISRRNRGFEGNTRRCPKCGKEAQRYKGDTQRIYRFECGKVIFPCFRGQSV